MANISLVFQGFEQAANEIINGKRENVTIEQKKEAQQFLADLKTYNNSLADDEKILDANSRHINPAQMNGRQKKSLADVFGVGSNDAARGRLFNRMKQTRDTLIVNT